ncbi:Importin N-terminal domain-containing protein [Plasmodiophora brassicae]|uniref:Importin N-terminal domain-containing protein n=1 Tax=Plasmodiophora brassicae TaxID=37360 RepID=A0A3P3Y9X9_PLABS|nr:unnamed protein product [Plasmodiophora brassicae]
MEVARLEALAFDMFSGADPRARTAARVTLMPFQSSAECIPQCQLLLQQSTKPEALLLAATSLLELLTIYWNRFDADKTVDMRNSLLQFLVQDRRLPPFVTSAVIRLLVRITKLGWLQNHAHRTICVQVGQLMASPTVAHRALALQILLELVAEMSSPTKSLSFAANRKVALSFRTDALLDIVTLAQVVLRSESGARSQCKVLALQLFTRCLAANVVGSQAEEALEETGSFMVPDSWRAVLADPSLFAHVLQLAASSGDQTEVAECLDALAYYARVRRSLFTPDAVRTTFLAGVCRGLLEISKRSHAVLVSDETLSAFARVLCNLKATFQLVDFYQMPDHRSWINEMAELTLKTFKISQNDAASCTLLKFWAGFAKAGRFTQQANRDDGQPRTMTPESLNDVILRLALIFMESQLDSVFRHAQRGELAEFLSDERLQEQMESLQVLFRHQYGQTAAYWGKLFDEADKQYREQLAAKRPIGSAERALIEGRISWLVHVGASVVGIPKALSGSRFGETTEQNARVDAEIAFRVLRLMECGSHGVLLEQAILGFLEQLRLAYLVDITRVLSTTQRAKFEQFYTALSSFCGTTMGHEQILSSIVVKLSSNLRQFADNAAITEACIELINQLSCHSFTGKLMKHLNIIGAIMSLTAGSSNLELRSQFYACWSRSLLVDDADDPASQSGNGDGGDIVDDQPAFRAAVTDVFQPQFAKLAAMSLDELRHTETGALAAVASDLRGVVSACRESSHFGVLFSWVEPHLPVFHRIMSARHDSAIVACAILSLLQELTSHRATPFSSNSADGIRLFRGIAPTLLAYARPRILHRESNEQAGAIVPGLYDDDDPRSVLAASPTNAGSNAGSPRQAGTRDATRHHDLIEDDLVNLQVFLDVVSRCLRGDFVQVGAMQFYQDRTAVDLIRATVLVVLSGHVPLQDIVSRVPLAKSYFGVVQVMFDLFADVALAEFDPQIVQELIVSVARGTTGFDHENAGLCFDTLASIFNFRFDQAKRRPQTTIAGPSPALGPRLDAALTAGNANVASHLLEMLLDMALFEADPNHAKIAKALLPLMLMQEKDFETYKAKLVRGHPEALSQRISRELSLITHGLSGASIGKHNLAQLAANLLLVRIHVAELGVRAVQ